MKDRAVINFGRYALGLGGRDLAAWYAASWWGHHASMACFDRMLVPERRHEVLELVEPVDWAPLNVVLRRNQGAIVAANHLGVPYVSPALLALQGHQFMHLANFSQFQHPKVEAPEFYNRIQYVQLFLRCFAHAREGGIVYVSPDGPTSYGDCEEKFLGLTIHLSSASAALARTTRAPVLPCVAMWEGSRIRVRFGPPPQPWATVPAEHDRQWMRHYLDWMEELARDCPSAIQFHHSLSWIGAALDRDPVAR